MCRLLSYILILYCIGNNGLEIVAQNENHCHESPCQNGGTCVDGIDGYTCQCKQTAVLVKDNDGIRPFITGYSGRHCELDINECLVTPSVCLNGGECRNEDGSFSCLCPMGKPGIFYSGLHCEKVTTYCEVAADVSDDLPACKNNGTCKPQPAGYLCHCPSGFTGKRCEENVDTCTSNPCRNNSTCVDGISGYACRCPDGMTGINCETYTHVCSPNPCLNGGVCHVENDTGYVCDCVGTGFRGKQCEDKNERNGALRHGAVKSLMVVNTILISLLVLS